MLTAFLTLSILPPQGYAQNLPAPGTMVYLSQGFTPPIVRGMTIDPTNPFQFDFIIDQGDSLYSTLEVEQRGADLLNPRGLGDSVNFRKEASKLIKYFLAALTVPEDQMWVNLSPSGWVR